MISLRHRTSSVTVFKSDFQDSDDSTVKGSCASTLLFHKSSSLMLTIIWTYFHLSSFMSLYLTFCL